eukprot:1158937-Pelagomonas_calceolata.AAC.7
MLLAHKLDNHLAVGATIDAEFEDASASSVEDEGQEAEEDEHGLQWSLTDELVRGWAQLWMRRAQWQYVGQRKEKAMQAKRLHA